MNTFKTKYNTVSNSNLYFIADIGANHDGDINKAIDLIHLVKENGGHAAKFQNFSAEKIVSKHEFDNMPKSTHQASWKKSVFEVYKDASIDENWTSILKTECDKIGIDYFTSPYDFSAVDKVNPYVDLFKIGSGDITWLEIIKYIIDLKKPVLIATGASNLNDVKRVMNLIHDNKADHVLMQCNTNYTGSLDNFKHINLNVLKSFKNLYPNSILGLSDHTPGHSTVLGSIALGSTVIEKHFTDSNENIGPDHFFAMNPKSWKEMVDRSYELFDSLGDGNKVVEKNEQQAYEVQRRSICVNKNVKINHILSIDDIIMLRPYHNDSFHPYELQQVLGKKINKNLSEGQSVRKNFIND